MKTKSFCSFNLFLLFFLPLLIFGQRKRIPQIEKVIASNYLTGFLIDVNATQYPESSYSITDLITNVLISGGSACNQNVSNVKVSPNLVITDTRRSFGYFSSGTTTFPFKSGIILSTGHAKKAGNTPLYNTLSDALGTSGDVDLATAIGVSNSDLMDATYVEFDFVPLTSTLNFNYILASEEYTENYPCYYTDGFALLIKKDGDSNYTNIAKLSTGDAVSVTNIHSVIPNPDGCPAKNESYFYSYNTANTETNFNGRTIPLKATATLIPGVKYHFKMVLADYLDDEFDTAVFLDAGSFNLGIDLQDESGIILSNSTTLCANGSKTISTIISAINPTFKWYKDGVLIAGATTANYTISEAGVYKVEVYESANTCAISTKSITVTLAPLPIANDTIMQECSTGTTAVFDLISQQVNISSQTGSIFTFYEDIIDAQAGNTSVIPSSNLSNYTSGAKTIYVRVGNGNCYKVVKLKLEITSTLAPPNISASSLILCENSTITLTSNYTKGNVWSTGETTQSINVTTAGIYTVYNIRGSCTSSQSSIAINQQPNINLQISGNLTPCFGSSTTLTSSSATGNVWSNGATTQSINVATSGNYSVVVTAASGCIFTKSVNVSVIPKISLSIATPTVLTCLVTSFALDASSSNYQNGDIISWNTLNGNIVSGANTLKPTINKAGTYTFTLKRNNCSESISVLVKENNQIPIISLKADRTLICDGESATLTVNGADIYTWSGLNSTQNTITVSPTKTTTYTVIGTNNNGCSTIENITINVLPKIVSNLEDGQICIGDFLVLDAGFGSGYTYTWNTGEKTQTIIAKTIGDYSVIVNNGACFEIFTSKISQAQIPKIVKVLYENDIITIIATNPSNGILEYTINNGSSWQSSNIFSHIEKNENYSIGARIKGTSCSIITSYFTFYMPNFITPNNDGYNDYINFQGVDILNNFQARIFNRNGVLVYTATSANNRWDGKNNGRILPTTAYWYIVTWEDPITHELQTKKGWVYLRNR